ncbi:ATP-binding protein [Bacillus sp. FJAT-27245]|uniref:ATP-binding protein n=1 Tax=Bacillus sp. FJAT-27245 TaxID=1684144 RepID=UPI0006A7A0B9|nr:SbcC/MukB-like Walker B domain-containing protein [Bacillus sp. FJAT-27245]
MKKLKLINWHYFQDEEIIFGKQTMITGRNAAGKSTIIDALQVLFIANLKMIRFNSSAHDDAKRSLISYLRGKIGSDQQKYIREGDFTTYIMAEFFDEKKRSYFTVGTVIDVYRDDNCDQEFFIINDCPLDNINYLNETGHLKNRDSFHHYVARLKNKTIQERSKEGYQKALLSRMGHVNPRFFSSFSKALSFKPIQNVRDFVYDYILDKKELQLDIMKENFEIHQKYKRELEDMGVRKAHLSSIKDIYSQYKKGLDTVAQQEYVIRSLELEKQKEDIKKLSISISGLQEKINHLTVEQEQANKEHETAKENSLTAFQKWQSYKDKNKQEELTKKINENSDVLSKMKNTFRAFIAEIETEKQMIEDLKSLPNNPYWECSDRTFMEEGIQTLESILAGLKAPTQENNLDNKQTLDKLGVELSDLYNKFVVAKNDTDKQITELKGKISKLNTDIQNLKNKKVTYPSSVKALKDLLERELSGKSQVWIFCEEMEVVDEAWRNAIEGYLHTQKFDVLVEPAFFEQALSAYEREKWNLKIEGAGLVNTNEEKEYLGLVQKGSLAGELETPNKVIKARIDHLLGKLMKVTSEKGLSQHRAAITSSCMLYQNLTARQIKKERYQVPYIGTKAIPRQLELKQQELDDTKMALVEIGVLQQLFEKWKNNLAEKRSQYQKFSEDLDLPIKISKLEAVNRELKQQLSQLDFEGIERLKTDYENCKRTEKHWEEEIKRLSGEIVGTKVRCEQQEEFLGNLKGEMLNLIECVSTWKKEHSPEMYNAAMDRLKEAEKQSVPLSEKIENWLGNQKGNETQAQKRFDKLKNVRHDYNIKHFYSGNEDAKDNNEYEHLLEQIDIDIESYKEKLEEALKQSEEEFKSHFIYKLREAIEDARMQFRILNDSLKKFPFHQESYQFEVKSSEKYKRFYNVIMDPNIMEEGTLFDLPEDEKHQSLHELFDVLIKGEAGEQEEFTDYRRYLDFDIIISNGSVDIKFSQVLKEKSGGETQTPFYIAILSSFNQLYSSNKTMRLVVFDEAFNKMDEERIQTSLRLIKTMNFQLIAAVPDEKLPNMAPEVSTIIMVHRDGYNCFTDMIDRTCGEDYDGAVDSQAVSVQDSLFSFGQI